MTEKIDTAKINKTIRFAPLNLRCDYTKEDGTTDTAILSWSIKNGYPRINVTTSLVRTETIDYNKLITAPFDYLNLEIFMDEFKEVIEAEGKTVRRIDCLNNKFVDGKRTDEIYLQATVFIIKGEDGVITLSVIEDKKQKLKFKVVSTGYHRNYTPAGDVIEKEGDKSKKFAKAYLKVLDKLMASELIQDGKYETIKSNTSQISRPSNPDVEVPSKIAVTKVETSDGFDLDKMLDM